METVRSTRQIERMFDEGKRASHPLLTLVVMPGATASPGRVVFIAGKKLGGAVVRNRLKRVLREAARRADAPWSGYDVALVARSETRDAAPEDLDAALRVLLSRSGVVRS